MQSSWFRRFSLERWSATRCWQHVLETGDQYYRSLLMKVHSGTEVLAGYESSLYLDWLSFIPGQNQDPVGVFWRPTMHNVPLH